MHKRIYLLEPFRRFYFECMKDYFQSPNGGKLYLFFRKRRPFFVICATWCTLTTCVWKGLSRRNASPYTSLQTRRHFVCKLVKSSLQTRLVCKRENLRHDESANSFVSFAKNTTVFANSAYFVSFANKYVEFANSLDEFANCRTTGNEQNEFANSSTSLQTRGTGDEFANSLNESAKKSSSQTRANIYTAKDSEYTAKQIW